MLLRPAPLLAALLAGCASQGDPPGGPPDAAPPRIVSVQPESGTVVPGWKDDAVLQFDEVIDEQPASGGGASLTGLARLVVLSPVAGDVKVEWGRTRIRVKPKEGWKPGRVYRLELRPGILDLRRNKLDSGLVVLFSTGPELGHATLRGTALQWLEQRALPAAVIEAVPLPDTVGYVTVADSGGRFQLDGLRPGRYLVYATADQNTNRRRDRREAYDSAAVPLDSSATVALFTFVHDTVGPRLRAATPVDSLTARIEFVQPLDGGAPLDSTRVRVVQLPDSTPVPLAAVLTSKQYDSLMTAERARANPDTGAARRDTTREGVGPPAPPRVDTTEVRRLLAQRPAPVDRIVLRFARPLVPETRYLIRVRGARSLSGVAGDGLVVLTTPKPPPAPPPPPPPPPP